MSGAAVQPGGATRGPWVEEGAVGSPGPQEVAFRWSRGRPPAEAFPSRPPQTKDAPPPPRDPTAMRAELYTTTTCPYCYRAKALLDAKGIPYVEHVMNGRFDELREVKLRYGHPTVPIVLLDGELVGGSDDLERLARAGGLD